jgi:hypothetical protein
MSIGLNSRLACENEAAGAAGANVGTAVICRRWWHVRELRLPVISYNCCFQAFCYHCAYLEMHQRLLVVQNAAQVVERRASLQVGIIDMPMLGLILRSTCRLWPAICTT